MNPTSLPGRIVIAGGSGFLGLNLARHLAASDRDVVVLIYRDIGQISTDHGGTLSGDARTLGDWVDQLDGCAGLVNLVGRTVDCVKTPEHCDEILRSRVESTKVLGDAVGQIKNPPPVWVQMSTAHIYGDPPEVVCDENSAFGYGLAPDVGRAWEDAFARAVPPQMRHVVLRTSFVMGRNGGALSRLVALARWGLGGKVGHGRQGISWIHERDMNRLLETALTDDSMRGAYLATAPQPVSNAKFMRELRRALRVPIGLPAMTWMVRLGAPLVMRTDPELALYGRYCVSKRLAEEEFEFEFSDVRSALVDLFRKQ